MTEEEFSEIGSVLAGDTGDECGFGHGSISLSMGFAFGLAVGLIFGHCIKFRYVLVLPSVYREGFRTIEIGRTGLGSLAI